MAAQRGEELNTRLTVTDDASKVIDNVSKEMADLEDKPHEIDLDSNADDVDSELSALDSRLAGLTKSEKRVVLELAAKDAERDLNKINRELARAEKYDDDEIAIRVNAKGDAERKLDKIQSEIRDLDGATPEIKPEVDSSELDDLLGKLGELTGFGGAFGAAGPFAAIGAVLGAAATQTRNIGTDVRTIATVLETSTQEASRLRAVFEDTGIEANDLQDIGLQVAGALSDNAELAKQVGLELEEAQNPAEALKAAINGWDFLSATERSQLFGEEGVRQVGRIIARGEDLEDLLDGVDAGRIWTDEDVERVGRLNEIVADFNGALEEMTLQIGGPLVDAVGRLEQALDFGPGSDNETGIVKSISDALDYAINGNVAGLPAPGEVLNDWLFGGSSNAWVDEQVRIARDGAVEIGRALAEGVDAGAKSSRVEVDGVTGAVGGLISELEKDAPTGLFGGLKDQAEDTGDAIEDDVLGPLDLLRQRLDQEDTFARIAEQFNKVKADPDDRDGVRRLLGLVLDLDDAYEDLPDEVITKLFTQIDQGSLEEAQRTLIELSRGQDVSFTVNPGVGFVIDPEGRNTPQQVDTSPQVGTTIINNHYPVTPTAGTVTQLSNDDTFANGHRYE